MRNVFLCHFIRKVEFLPRQARDKHREKLREMGVSAGNWVRLRLPLPALACSENTTSGIALNLTGQKTSLFCDATFLLQTEHVQDRLGTNIGKAQQKTRVLVAGMGSGEAWVNGHSIGRYSLRKLGAS